MSYLAQSSRAQARTILGREFPNHVPFRYARRVPNSTIIHVSCTLSKIPDIGFSPIRLQKQVVHITLQRHLAHNIQYDVCYIFNVPQYVVPKSLSCVVEIRPSDICSTFKPYPAYGFNKCIYLILSLDPTWHSYSDNSVSAVSSTALCPHQKELFWKSCFPLVFFSTK